MILNDLTDGLTRIADNAAHAANSVMDPSIRLGVTGLSRAGKTVFITSLVANLIQRGRMPQLTAAANGAIQTAYLQPQPDDTIPRFPYEEHLDALTGPTPHWPEGTRHISELRLSLKVQPRGLLGRLQGIRTVHLDIVDYPGEWLLDVGLLDRSYADWAQDMLARLDARPEGADYAAQARATDPAAKFDEPSAKRLAEGYTAYLNAARKAGFSDLSPGRFLLPGEMAGSPALTFAPLPRPDGELPRKSLWREMDRRFEAYKRHVAKPFFRDHFSRIDRQIVLADVLGAIHAGPQAVEDLRVALGDILGAFKPGRSNVLSRFLTGQRIERILFAATKADHLHHAQHPHLTAITEALLADARSRADYAGAQTAALSLAALRATTEDRLTRDGQELPVVMGTLEETGKRAAFYPGALPKDPAAILSPARAGARDWLDADYGIMNFAPAPLTMSPGDGPPHIRLDRAAQFLLGDKF